MDIFTLDDIIKLPLALADDVERAEKEMDINDDFYSRRNHIRALFAMIEGTVYVLKQTALAKGLSTPGSLTPDEIAKLEEKNINQDIKGEPRSQARFLPFLDNIRFTKKCLEKVFGFTIELNFKDKGWDALTKAQKIRNRIIHPKTLEELDVSKDESQLARRVSRWFEQILIEWFAQFLAKARVESRLSKAQDQDNPDRDMM